MSHPSPTPALPARPPAPTPPTPPLAAASQFPTPTQAPVANRTRPISASPTTGAVPTDAAPVATPPPATAPTLTGTASRHPAASGVVGGVRRRAAGDDRGQASAEYGLVIIVAATIAVALIAWATQTGAITGFFDAVVERLTGFL